MKELTEFQITAVSAGALNCYLVGVTAPWAYLSSGFHPLGAGTRLAYNYMIKECWNN
jgi:hypothetical protein